MRTLILKQHDQNQVIGFLNSDDAGLFFEFRSDVEITREEAFEIFGNAGIRVLEQSEKNGVILIRKGQIVEFSQP